ncbi:hypothetical protein [Saccharopolyspora phatthalungensis]|uniref:Uncharacterized protein n=1 Tax=Saccharopolyspora phatthalungensis TaxID=664693 RepID=A0A840Q292_9PSEU|nr:hypothetical protein [Saccharopolyspora phatthalungensis]MBB5154117.1 hypothetical protein [Saccharopolyspora phatthalungensis]
MSEQASFVEAHLAGKALLDDIDDWVDAWHDADGAPCSRVQSLASYLGLTDDEYALWVERPESLRFAIAGKRMNRPSAEVAELGGVVAAAARAGNDAEAAGVLHWLKQTGRLPQQNDC